jgi:hypothetical protein
MRRFRIEPLAILTLIAFTGLGSASATGGAISSSQSQGRDTVTCTRPDATTSVGSVTLSDFADGVSSDDRGRYVLDSAGVATTEVHDGTWLSIYGDERSAANLRRFRVNLNNPVPGGGGTPLGIITTGNGAGFHTRWWDSTGHAEPASPCHRPERHGDADGNRLHH